MVTENNAQINTFHKGMNTDLSLDLIQEGQYTYGQNIRINTEILLGALQDSNKKKGIVTPVPEGESIDIETDEKLHRYPIESILAVNSIGDKGVIIYKSKDVFNNNIWCAIRVTIKDSKLVFKLEYVSKQILSNNKYRFSTVFNNEISNIYKLYIADGVNKPIVLFIDYDGETNQDKLDESLISDYMLSSNTISPKNRIKIVDKISGKLKTSQVQYTYRFYKKYGITSKLAPLTNKIQVINEDKSSEIGNAEDTYTSIGFQIKIEANELNYLYPNLFDKIQIFRISYIKPNTNADIAIIYDGDITEINNKYQDIILNDFGIQSLQDISFEEFSSMQGIDIIPQSIEQNQNYLFAANIEDITELRLDNNKQFNTQAYSFNKNGQAKLYQDSSYSDKEGRVKTITKNNIDNYVYFDTYYINKYSDMNIYTLQDPDDNELYVFDKDGYYGGSGPLVSWRFITTAISLNENCTDDNSNITTQDQIPAEKNYKSKSDIQYLTRNYSSTEHKIQKVSTGYDTLNYFAQKDVYQPYLTYNDQITSSLLRSLKRNEVYRYGIVFYTKKGKHTNVNWIADIRTPKCNDLPTFGLAKPSDVGDIELENKENIQGYEYKIDNVYLTYPDINQDYAVVYPSLQYDVYSRYVFTDGSVGEFVKQDNKLGIVTYSIENKISDNVQFNETDGRLKYTTPVEERTKLCNITVNISVEGSVGNATTEVFKNPSVTTEYLIIANTNINKQQGLIYEANTIETSNSSKTIILDCDALLMSQNYYLYTSCEYATLSYNIDDSKLTIQIQYNNSTEDRNFQFRFGVSETQYTTYIVTQHGKDVITDHTNTLEFGPVINGEVHNYIKAIHGHGTGITYINPVGDFEETRVEGIYVRKGDIITCTRNVRIKSDRYVGDKLYDETIYTPEGYREKSKIQYSFIDELVLNDRTYGLDQEIIAQEDGRVDAIIKEVNIIGDIDPNIKSWQFADAGNLPYSYVYEDRGTDRHFYRKFPIKYEITYTFNSTSKKDQPSHAPSIPTKDENKYNLYAYPLGIQFDVNVDKLNSLITDDDKITSYQIVRCAKDDNFTSNIMQCVLSRPINQKLWQNYIGDNPKDYKNSPYYPTGFITTSGLTYKPSDGLYIDKYPDSNASSLQNNNLFCVFNPEINLLREDTLQKLKNEQLNIYINNYLYHADIDIINDYISDFNRTLNSSTSFNQKSVTTITKDKVKNAKKEQNKSYNKEDVSFLFKLYLTRNVKTYNAKIQNIADVKNPTWEQGFSNLQIEGSKIKTGIKQYKSYNTQIGTDSYVNWVASGMYDMKVGSNPDTDPNTSNDNYRVFCDSTFPAKLRSTKSSGWIGPGPVCFLLKLTTEDHTDNYFIAQNDRIQKFGSLLCNIYHSAQQYSGSTLQEMQYDTYYGFGNYQDLDKSSMQFVFDGSTYITPCEFVSMFKAYDFNSIGDSLPSAQIVYYVPLESKINTYFDYGQNYKNTTSKNLQLEPGSIKGIAEQTRPLHQYNSIYSDNEKSNDIFNFTLQDTQINKYKQRIYYSQLKTNGESIDNWCIFKPANFIDANSQYGEITHLYTSKDVIYYWQQSAFGKLSVNERSLVNDTNNNTIQLGVGDVLQRTDYINTKYGMRNQDYCAINVNNYIFWVDILNKAILAFTGEQVQNYGKTMYVQNILNERIEESIDKRPLIHFDIQNGELCCSVLKRERQGNDQLIFNIENNIAQSVYNREYTNILSLNNIMYGLYNEILDYSGTLQYNYLKDDFTDLLKPTVLQFVVNKIPINTKVFDNQKIVTLKRRYKDMYNNSFDFAKQFMKHKTYKFTTDIQDCEFSTNKEYITDREGNIQYAIPRFKCNDIAYGNRLRGKWMQVKITDDNPRVDFSISNIITTFRQSIS